MQLLLVIITATPARGNGELMTLNKSLLKSAPRVVLFSYLSTARNAYLAATLFLIAKFFSRPRTVAQRRARLFEAELKPADFQLIQMLSQKLCICEFRRAFSFEKINRTPTTVACKIQVSQRARRCCESKKALRFCGVVATKTKGFRFEK